MNYSKLVCTIVEHGHADRLVQHLRTVGATGSTVLFGRSLRGPNLLQFIAMADVVKDFVMTLATEDQAKSILEAINSFPIKKPHEDDMVFVIQTGGSSMSTQIQYELINVIVTRGYADDIMEAARKAGATGGTILHARGTGQPDDEKFFGITIVPEKEQILILAKKEESAAIQQAIEDLDCLSEPGMGIIFTIPVEHFNLLGKPKKSKH